MAIEFDYSPIPFPELGQPRGIDISGPSISRLIVEAELSKVDVSYMASVYQKLGDEMIRIGGTEEELVFGDAKSKFEPIDFRQQRFAPYDRAKTDPRQPLATININAEEFDVLAEVANIYQCTVEQIFERFINAGTYVTEGLRRNKRLYIRGYANGQENLKYYPIILPKKV